MLRRRISLGAALVALGAGFSAAPAQAAVAYTGQANAGMTTATAYGYVTPQPEKTAWTFLYGPTAKYGQYTKIGTLPAGSSPMLVAAPIAGLQAGATYHYRLFAVPEDSSGNPDWADASYGQDATFTTTRGSLELLSTHLSVRHGAVSVPLKCASTLACSASVRVQARGSSHRTITCAAQRVALTANQQRSSSLKVGVGCLGLLRQARGHRITATVSATVSTGQLWNNQSITLLG